MRVKEILSILVLFLAMGNFPWSGNISQHAMAQEASVVETTLRRRVAEFYALMKAKRSAEAERLVTADTLEQFRLMPNGEFLGVEVDSMEISKDGKSATININLLVSSATLPVPFQLPRKTNWRLESDGWRIVIPQQTMESGASSMFKSTAPQSGKLPSFDLQFTQPIVDVTPIKQGEKKIAKFSFTNSAAHPVTIVNIEADCGCVVMKTVKKTYKPGEAGELEMEFDSTKYAYDFGQTVAIITEPGNQRINLLLKASVAPKQ